MKNGKFISLKQRISLIVGIGVFITAAILIIYATLNTRKEAISNAKSNASALAKDFASEISKEMEVAITSARSMAEGLSSVDHGLSIDREDAMLMGEEILFSHPDFLGFTIAFEPNAFDGKDSAYVNAPAHDETGRFVVYLTKKSDGTAAREVLINYTNPEKAPWYWMPKRKKREFVTEPVIYPVQGKEVFMVSFMTPIMVNGQFIGETGIDYPISFMQNSVEEAGFYDGEAGLSIISHDGVIAAYSKNPDILGEKIGEIVKDQSGEVQEIQQGISQTEVADGELFVQVPINVGRTQRPWQVRMAIPMGLITAEADKQMWRQLGIGAILIVMSILILRVFVGRLTNPLKGMAELANTAAEGDLRAAEDIETRNDEIGILHDAFIKMMSNIRQVVENVKEGTNNINSASAQLSNTSQSISQGANEQASSVEEVSSSMEEMASNIQQNTDNSSQTEKIASQAADEMEKMDDAGKKSLKSIREIADKITIINDIDFQTNILALNAAVEAARAGEYGKGFAVVASEVRKLAERSKQAADEIVELSSSSVEVTKESDELLTKLVPEIEKTSKLIQEINAASQEQNSGADQINNAIQQLNDVTQQNAASSEELATSAEELSSQAEQLNETIAFFKTGEEKTTKNQFAVKPNQQRSQKPADSQQKSTEKKSTTTKAEGNSTMSGKSAKSSEDSTKKTNQQNNKGIDLSMGNSDKDDDFETY